MILPDTVEKSKSRTKPLCDTERYLRALYGRCTEGHIVLAHKAKNRHAVIPVTDLDRVSAEITKAPRDVFIKFNPLDGDAVLDRGPYAVGGADEVVSVVALAADIDVGKDGKYASYDQTRDALTEMPLPPSIVVQTKGPGSGLHAYWVLDQPTPPSDQTASVSLRWQDVLRSKLDPFPLDATHEHSRFLRPPGSTRDNGATVAIIQMDETRRYSIEDFEPHLLPPEPEPTFEPCDDADKVIGKYLDDQNVTVEKLLSDRGWTPATKPGFWNHPKAASGSPSGELYVSPKTSEPGFTIKSGAAELPPGWYSRDRLWVEFQYGGDWKQAATAVHEWNDAKLNNGVSIAGITGKAPPQKNRLRVVHADELLDKHRHLREPIIDGLLRAGETMNVIAAPKTGKSWLVHGLAAALSSGNDWLGRSVKQGRTLIIDAELHAETLANRIRKVFDAGGGDARYADVVALRGRHLNVHELAIELQEAVARKQYSTIILDALYRLLPSKMSESDNAAMMAVYNAIDSIAENSEAAIVIVHHTSKGDQSQKGVTDVGSGAGAISRAADTHLAVRQHELESCVVIDAVTRSFPQSESITLRWDYPLWLPSNIEPQVKTPRSSAERKQERNDAEAKAAVLDVLEDRIGCVVSYSEIRRRTGFGSQRVERILALIAAENPAVCLKRRKNRKSGKKTNTAKLGSPSKTPSES